MSRSLILALPLFCLISPGFVGARIPTNEPSVSGPIPVECLVKFESRFFFLDPSTFTQDDSAFYILLRQAKGTCSNPVTFSTRQRPETVCSGDFNGDNHRAGLIALLCGNGNGTFRAPVNAAQPLDFFPNGASTVVDIYADDGLDLSLLANSGYLSVPLGNGDGTFASAQRFATGATPARFLLQDINADQRPDAIATAAGGVTAFISATQDGDDPNRIFRDNFDAVQ